MGRLYDRILVYFSDWSFSKCDEDCFIKIQMDGKNGSWEIAVSAYEERQMISVLSLFPELVPVEKRDDVSLWMVQTNYTLFSGFFDMDMNSGELCFRTGLILEDTDVTDPILKALVEVNVTYMDCYFNDLLEIVKQNQN